MGHFYQHYNVWGWRKHPKGPVLLRNGAYLIPIDERDNKTARAARFDALVNRMKRLHGHECVVTPYGGLVEY